MTKTTAIRISEPIKNKDEFCATVADAMLLLVRRNPSLRPALDTIQAQSICIRLVFKNNMPTNEAPTPESFWARTGDRSRAYCLPSEREIVIPVRETDPWFIAATALGMVSQFLHLQGGFVGQAKTPYRPVIIHGKPAENKPEA